MIGVETRRRLAQLLIVVSLVATTGACVRGQADVVGVDGKDVRPLAEGVVPGEILGLKVMPEEISGVLPQFRETYFDALSLFALRQGDRLEATMQVGHLNAAAAKTENLQEAIVDQIGGARARRVRYGGTTVHLAEVTKQQLAVWFHGEHVFVLSTRADFDQPRNLLRAALAIDPGTPR